MIVTPAGAPTLLAQAGEAPLSTLQSQGLEIQLQGLGRDRRIDHTDAQQLAVRADARDEVERIGGAAGAYLRVKEADRIFGLGLRRVALHRHRRDAGPGVLAGTFQEEQFGLFSSNPAGGEGRMDVDSFT